MRRRAPAGEVDRAVLEALRNRAEEGMTVFEVRNRVAADIDRIEEALERCKVAGFIEADREGDRLVLYPTDAGLRAVDDAEDAGLVDRLRDRLDL
ncbi:MAG: DUF6432 family protein [Halobacteriales archaeon]